MKLAGLAIALVQLFDILLHAATNQLEPLRVTSNLIILLWLVMADSGRLNTRLRLATLVSIGAYLLLNLVFLAREGLTNPAQGGALRISLFGLVFVTVALSGLFIYLQKMKK